MTPPLLKFVTIKSSIESENEISAAAIIPGNARGKVTYLKV
jgi:hypothetical protein